MTTVVFDLGGVVVIWDPVPAIAAVVGETRAEHFVHGSEFDFAMWNHAQDSGRSWADAEAALADAHVVVELVGAGAQVSDAEDHQLAVVARQAAAGHQPPGEPQPPAEQAALFAEGAKQVGVADAGGAREDAAQ